MKRNFLIISGLFSISGILSSCQQKQDLIEVEVPQREVFQTVEKSKFNNPAIVKTTQGPFEMEGLPYLYDNLIPFLLPENIELHYSKHHLGYANNLNNLILNTPLEKKSIEEILQSLDLNNRSLRNNAGGFYNHNLYWKILTPKTNLSPGQALTAKINRDFGSVAQFKDRFKKEANQVFSSGWVWLVSNYGKLEIQTTQNQDNPLMPLPNRGTPLIGIDLWEHAYYPTYKHNKNEYITNFLEHIDWNYVDKIFETL